MPKVHQVITALIKQHSVQIEEIETTYRQIRALTRSAFASHEEGKLDEARRLLSLALDLECEISGDCQCLGDLVEEWGIDEEGRTVKDRP